MNPRERIARLEALLARVSARRSEARQAPTDGKAFMPPAAAVAEAAVTEIDAEELQTVPPPPIAPSTPSDSDLLESRERLVVAPPAIEVDVDDAPTDVPPPVAPISAAAAAAAGREAPELEAAGSTDVIEVVEEEAEEPPASSKRPIAIEPPLEELTFGAAPQPPPQHTPPPESGRQVAAPPVDLDFEGDFTGVRHRPSEAPAAAKAAAEAAGAPTPHVPSRPAVNLPPQSLEPEVTRRMVIADGEVASFMGGAVAFKPATFGELLDATLEL